MIGVYAPMISEKPSRDTPAYKADKNAFAGFTLKINAMISKDQCNDKDDKWNDDC